VERALAESSPTPRPNLTADSPYEHEASGPRERGETTPIVELVDIHKRYQTGVLSVDALRGVSLRIDEGEFVAIIGPSGSGKSTLMHILGCLDHPTSGSYDLAGVDVSEMNEVQLADVRNRRIGFVFQQFNLLTALSACRNVELPLVYAGVERHDRKQRAMASLARVDLANRSEHRPNELSGGQQQRVAVARALVNEPTLVLADEPTGNLDSASAADVLGLLGDLHRSGRTVILITHDAQTASTAQRVVRLKDGLIQSDEATSAGGLDA
jgi:putative ABC transport system ATP-binding protein